MNPTLPIIPVRYDRIFYAVAIIAWGVQQFIFGYLIAARPLPWPEGISGQNILAYASGALLIITGLTILLNKRSNVLLIAVAAYMLLCAALPTLYHVLSQLDYGGTLTNLGKALTLGSGALLVAKSYNNENDSSVSENKIVSLGSWCQYLTGFFLLASGIQHFLFAEFVKFLMPVWIPGSIFWTYFSGVALAAAGLGLLTNIKSQLAATLAGWMIFIWLFTLHLPRAIENNNQNEWTAVFEALAVSGVLFLIADTIKKRN